jgi:predicted DNA-binding transcriptional regulator AlpA
MKTHGSELVSDPYVGGIRGVQAAFERRGRKAPSRQTFHRMIANGQFPAGTPLGADPTSARCPRDWKQSVVDGWFAERDALAAKPRAEAA